MPKDNWKNPEGIQISAPGHKPSPADVVGLDLHPDGLTHELPAPTESMVFGENVLDQFSLLPGKWMIKVLTSFENKHHLQADAILEIHAQSTASSHVVTAQYGLRLNQVIWNVQCALPVESDVLLHVKVSVKSLIAPCYVGTIKIDAYHPQ